MPQTFHVVFFGPPEQRVTVKPTPMTKLEAVLQEACQKFKSPLDPQGFTLHFQKKVLDLSSAVRFINLPQDCRLDLVKVEPAAPLTAAAMPRMEPASSSTAQAPPSLSGRSSEPVVAAADGSLDTEVVLFTHQALEQATAALPQGDDEPPDEFFELTPEDYFTITGAQERKKKAHANFKTQAARDEETQKRAASYGPVALRLHLPGGVIMQANFAATDPLIKVKELVLQAVRPDATKGLYLYTTPPRQVLKDMDASLHHHQLVPAAHVYVGVPESEKNSSVLRPQLADRVKHELPVDILPVLTPQPHSARPGGSDSSARVDSNTDKAAGGATRSSSSAAAGKKPKWLKLGPK